MALAYIYGLFDPRNPIELQHCRYIGQTIQRPIKRLYQHVTDSNAGKPRHVNKWIRSILREDIHPIVSVIGVFDRDDRESLDLAEIQWIALCRSIGCNLTNHNEGGGGNRGFIPDAETRAKLSAVRTGRPLRPETRRKMSESSKGKPKSPEHRAALSAALTGKPLTSAQIEANAKRRGVPRSSESIAKQRESALASDKVKAAGERRRGVPMDESTRAAISAANTNNPGIIAASQKGNQRFKELMQDPEYAAEWNRKNQVALDAAQHSMRTKRMQCDECGFISNPQGIGHHQTSFGHSGKTMLEPLPD